MYNTCYPSPREVGMGSLGLAVNHTSLLELQTNETLCLRNHKVDDS